MEINKIIKMMNGQSIKRYQTETEQVKVCTKSVVSKSKQCDDRMSELEDRNDTGDNILRDTF